MVGISGYNSIMYDDEDYQNLNRLEKLEHDLLCLMVAGFSGAIGNTISTYYETRNDIYNTRQWFIDDINKMILNEQRKLKLKNINKI